MPGGEKIDIHFTAGNGRAAFRRKIAHVPHEKFAATFEQFGLKALDVYLHALAPVSLIELEREGWVACGPIWQTVQRWTAYVFQTCGRFRFDADTVKPFVLHLVRHQVLPSVLATQPSVPGGSSPCGTTERVGISFRWFTSPTAAAVPVRTASRS